MPRSFIVKLFKKFKLLKVMDFEDAPIDYLPQEVGNLFHLKHLSLRRTKVKILPKSVGRLLNLQTINVTKTAMCELPIGLENRNKCIALENIWFEDDFVV
jgi:disease resistance protein RPM1